MGKREPEIEPEPESTHRGAAERMVRLQRRTCAFMVLERAGLDPQLEASHDLRDDGLDALEADVAKAGLTNEYEAAFRNKEWANRG